MYCGCRGCPAKTLWAIFTILLLGGLALLAGGLVRTVPCTTDLANCEKGLAKGSTQHTVCWDTYWTCTSGVARESFPSRIDAGWLIVSRRQQEERKRGPPTAAAAVPSARRIAAAAAAPASLTHSTRQKP
jgi:hypothetical protein